MEAGIDEKAIRLSDPKELTMALAKAKVKHQVFNVLTPEQQEKWQNFKEKKRAKMQQRMLSNS